MAEAGGADGKLSPQQLKEEKKALKAQAKELKKQRKALEEAADDEEEGGAISVILVTIVIIVIWLAILALLIKLDVGGFGSNVLAPVLKDVPVLNKVLPDTISGNAVGEDGENVIGGGYDNLEDAVNRIKELELELADAEQDITAAENTINDLTTELARLKTFEDNQVEFEKIKDEFDEEVVFNSHAPDITEYQKYYEQIDPTNAEILYKEVIRREQEDELVKQYAKAYSSMKPSQAAGIFESMTDALDLAAKILDAMSADARGAILGQMDSDIAAQITKIMEPDETGE
ncbi:MAG: hypothetical protein K6F35_04480 [Lachnospiraceae bacterium]|nr:hypothetical protein [Lachnospiraceae bacterium]